MVAGAALLALATSGCTITSYGGPTGGGEAGGSDGPSATSDGGPRSDAAPGDGLLGVPADVVIVGANVIPISQETVLAGQTIFVKDGKISRIEPMGRSSWPAGATVVDATGKYVIPGLADMHVHYNTPIDRLLYVALGVTTIRNMWGDATTLQLKQQIASGSLVGPEVHTTGPLMDGSPPVWPDSTVVTTAQQAADSVRQQAQQGFEYIKVYDMLSLVAYDAIVATAAQVRLPVVGHVPEAVGLTHVLSSRQRSIEHLTGYNLSEAGNAEETLTVQAGTWNVPTLALYDKEDHLAQLQGANLPEFKYVCAASLQEWRTATKWGNGTLSQYQAKMMKLRQAGAPILAGTDTVNPYLVAGFALHDELVCLVGAGLSPYQALRIATYDAAVFLGTTERSGTVEEGKDADLVILAANPLSDIHASKPPVAVLVKGRYYDRQQLDQFLQQVASTVAAGTGC